MENQNIIIYTDDKGQVSLDVSLQSETVWLSQKQLCVLFDRDKSVISRHIKNIYKEGELDEKSVVAKNATTATIELIKKSIEQKELGSDEAKGLFDIIGRYAKTWALLTAASEAKQKEVMVKLIVNLLGENNKKEKNEKSI